MMQTLPHPGRAKLESNWRECWRVGFAPQFDVDQLVKLSDALRDDNCHLVQGISTVPPFCLSERWDDEVDDRCAVCWPLSGRTVKEVNEQFQAVIVEADRRLGMRGESHWFLDWFDLTPRGEMRIELLAEIERTIVEKVEASGEATFTCRPPPG